MMPTSLCDSCKHTTDPMHYCAPTDRTVMLCHQHEPYLIAEVEDNRQLMQKAIDQAEEYHDEITRLNQLTRELAEALRDAVGTICCECEKSRSDLSCSAVTPCSEYRCLHRPGVQTLLNDIIEE